MKLFSFQSAGTGFLVMD